MVMRNLPNILDRFGLARPSLVIDQYFKRLKIFHFGYVRTLSGDTCAVTTHNAHQVPDYVPTDFPGRILHGTC